MPLEQVPCSSPRPNSQRAHNTVCSLENYVFGRRSIPRPDFASVRGGQPKTDLFRRYRSPARGLSDCARVSAQKPDVISRVTRAGTWREVLEFARLPLPLASRSTLSPPPRHLAAATIGGCVEVVETTV